ncbi:hypothetical protein [Thermococcus sp.]|uniref:hypothetical protein n=1 Tax=Thermococcus sp. TaxID=35749 RepID=UPI00262AF0AF|nr:hypothetical protein [Thermococcus sp.]
MKYGRLLLALLGLFATTGLLSGLVNAATVSPTPQPMGVHWKQISACEWYGEDIETKSLSLLGGGGAFASAYFHTCYPTYWHDAQNRGWVFGQADLIMVIPRNDLYTVQTETYFSVFGAVMRVTASVGFPQGSV